MDTLVASTRYTDWEGTSAADDAHEGLHEYLKSKQLLQEEEYVAAITFYSSENYVSVRVFASTLLERKRIAEAAARGERLNDAELRKIRLEVTPVEFLKFFKRLNVVFVAHNLTGALEEIDIDNIPDES